MAMPIAATIITGPVWIGSGIGEAAHRLPGDGPDRDQQHHGVGQRGQDRALAQAVGVAPGRGLLGQDHRAPGHEQAQHVRKVVAGVGQQGQRMGHQPGDGLGRHEADVQGRADREGPPKSLGAWLWPPGP
jgi:hypothetical protein